MAPSGLHVGRHSHDPFTGFDLCNMNFDQRTKAFLLFITLRSFGIIEIRTCGQWSNRGCKFLDCSIYRTLN